MYWGINARFIIYGVLSALLFLAGWNANGWRLEAKYQERVNEALLKAREIEQRLTDDAEKTRKKKDAEIKAINNRLESVTRELRQRPSRTSQSPTSCPAGTGSSLFAEDGEFLIREAARADKLREALKECYERYDGVAERLNK